MTPPTTSANPLLPGGAREFKTRTAAWIPYVFGGCFGVAGLIATVIGIAGLAMGGGSGMALPMFIGLVFLAIGVGIPVGSYFLGKTYAISCRPDGFNVRTDNKRKGSEQRDYPWESVSATQYEEFRSRSRRGNRTYISFTVETDQGRAFKVGPEIGDFPTLIKLFNAMTPHLPYTWEPQAGFSVGVGAFSVGRSGYVRTPRASSAPPASPPATTTPSGPPPLPSV